jgi:dihydrofolate reductase
MEVFVISRTLRQQDHPDVTIVRDPEKLIAELRSKPGKQIWLFGGGSLFRSLAELQLVDTVEFGVIPVLLGERVPLMSPRKASSPEADRTQALPQNGNRVPRVCRSIQ